MIFELLWGGLQNLVVASGLGERSRLYRTTDGCKTWKLLLKNHAPDGFYDAVTFGDRKHGLLLGDPVKSMPFALDNPAFMDSHKKHWVRKLKKPKFLTLETRDAGEHWEHRPLRNADLIDAGEGGAAFPASNTSVVIPT